MLISLDTETTGKDFAHGTKPFIVTTTDDKDVVRFWEWDVDPKTRQPEIPDEDLRDVAELIDAADTIYLHNSRFDAHALASVGIELPWPKVRDSFIMAHLLESNQKKDLTSLCVHYLGRDISKYEDEVEGIVKVARGIAKKEYPAWRIAAYGDEAMPSIKKSSDNDEDKPWKADMWLPRALIRAGCRAYIPEAWATATADYANADSVYTLPLGLEMERVIRDRGLWAIYMHRMELPRIAYTMEAHGVTGRTAHTETTMAEYELSIAELGDELCGIAEKYGHELELAKGAGINDNMRDFFYGGIIERCPSCKYTNRIKHWLGAKHIPGRHCPKCAGRKRRPARYELRTSYNPNLNLPPIRRDHGGRKKAVVAALDKEAIAEYLTSVDGDPKDFIELFLARRKRCTDLAYMEAYRRFSVPVPGDPGAYRIRPNLNPCATNHLRWGSNNPNLQNVGKQEDECDECKDDRGRPTGRDASGAPCAWCNGYGLTRISARYCFGPAAGWEWWSMDFQNIELRIPAYESGEEAMIELFERPNDPPYFGSYHCLNASIVYPDEFMPLAEVRDGFKKRYKSTLYQYTKNGGFAMQYDCGREKADRTFRRPGAYDMLKAKLPKVANLSRYYVDMAKRLGYVTTLPDSRVDPKRGYPVYPSRAEGGGILTTTPFNYHVSGTACWIKNMALIECDKQLAAWRKEGFDARIILEIHDEILFEFPRGRDMAENLPRALVLKGIMERCGDYLTPRIPTPVSMGYHDTTWAKEVAA